MGHPDGEVAQAARLRGEAEATFARRQAQQRYSRAELKATSHSGVHTGDLVFYWPSQLYGKKVGGTRIQTGRAAGYAGPARILALETRRDQDNKIRASSVVWLVRNNRLLKASVEQLRFASAREELLHDFERPSSLPWTMTELTSPLTKEEYEDITAEVPSEADKDEHGEAPRWRPPERRVRQKRAPDLQPLPEQGPDVPQAPEVEMEQGAARHDDVESPRARTRSPPRARAPRASSSQEHSFWAQETAAVALEIPMPTTRHGWKLASRDLETYLASALKKKSVEVYEKNMDPGTKERFAAGSEKEAMRMRWILSWKTDHSGTTSPKARAVVLGYQDPNYEHRITYAPTTTRHTRQLMLQMAACKNWHAWKGDVSAAFLQGRECGYDLYCIPTPELCEGMGIPKESVARLRKACYGLVQAPYEWYETVRAFLLESGFYQCATDPCCWVLQVEGRVHAIISGHVDDFMMI
ncbi:RE2, partial [Symbiodinium pilosum]